MASFSSERGQLIRTFNRHYPDAESSFLTVISAPYRSCVKFITPVCQSHASQQAPEEFQSGGFPPFPEGSRCLRRGETVRTRPLTAFLPPLRLHLPGNGERSSPVGRKAPSWSEISFEGPRRSGCYRYILQSGSLSL